MKVINRDQKPIAHRTLLLTCLLTLAGCNLLFAFPVRSQSKSQKIKRLASQDLQQSVISGGGGTSTAGGIKIDGSIGQAATEASGGDNYALESGFWPSAVPCPFAIAPLGQFFPMAGGQGSIDVSAAASCSWSLSSTEAWVIINSAESGTGTDLITYELRENFTRSARQTTINVSGQAQLIVQDGGLGEDCTYEINPAFMAHSAAGGSGALQVVTPERCAWQAVASESWITIAPPGVGIGDATVRYSVAPNPGASGRDGTIMIGGKSFAVKQKKN